MEPLDNPAWHALTGGQARFAQGDGLALRYDPEISVFAALPDRATPESWDALRTLVGPGGIALLFREPLEPAAGWDVVFELAGHQFVAPDDLGSRAEPERFTTLGADDVADMVALVERTRPGPFTKRTHELGHYIGVRDEEGGLAAMAGERMRPTGHTEISAVCTDEAHRGRGLATALMHTLAAEIRDRGEIPMLHTASDNATAIALYEHLRFTRRSTLAVVALRAPS